MKILIFCLIVLSSCSSLQNINRQISSQNETSLQEKIEFLTQEPTESDIQILKDKLETSKSAWNNGDFYWQDPIPYYYASVVDVLRYKNVSYETFVEYAKEGSVLAEYLEWIDFENYERYQRALDVDLEPYEIAALVAYTRDLYTLVNPSFYSAKDDSDEVIANSRVINAALKKLPAVSPTTVYRCDHWNPEKIDNLKAPKYVSDMYTKNNVGEEYRHNSFMSTTRARYDIAKEKFVKTCPFLRIIKTKERVSAARDVILFSPPPSEHEEEVLFLPYTNLKIMKYEEKKIGRGLQKILHMEEI